MPWPWGRKGTSPAVPRDAAPGLRWFAQGNGEGACWGAVVSWLGGAALAVSAPLEHRVCTGKARQPSGSDGSPVSSVCAQSLLPLGTGLWTTDRHSACVHLCYVCIHVHSTRMYTYTYVQYQLDWLCRAMPSVSMNSSVLLHRVRFGEKAGTW